MIFDNWIKRKLATHLIPFLQNDDADIDIKLGFFRSNGTLNDISFDVSILNQSLDDPSKFCFREVSVAQLSLQFSPFSSNAFTLVVRGVNVVLSVGEERDEGGVAWRRKVKDVAVEERNNVLKEIDPEGCALHGSIKKISEITNIKWGDSLLNTVLGQCQLQLHDVSVLLQSPRSHEPLSCSLYIEKLAAGCRKTGHKCFVRGFLSSIFVPSEESSFDVDVNGLKISLNSEKHTSCVVPTTDMFVLVNMYHLQFMSFCFHVPALKFSLSTRDLSLMLLFCELLSKELKCPRPGKQLWNIVACRISSLTPNMSWIKLVRLLCVWLRYIKDYKRILLLVGYPADGMLRKSTTLMLRNARYSKSVKSQWKIINETENDLPLKAIILARRIIRSTVASNGENEGLDKLVDSGSFSKLHQLIMLILSTFIVLLHKILDVFRGDSWRHSGVHEDFVLRESISLNINEIEVSLSPNIAVYSSVNRKPLSDSAISQRNLLSFHLSVNDFFLRHLATISEQRLTFASGCIKVLSSSLVEISASNYARIHQEKKHDDRNIIILGEPAQSIFSGPTHNAATDEVSDTSVPSIASLLGKLWLNWQDSCLKSEGENSPTVQNPWILCDIRCSLTDRGLNSRFLDSALVVGRVNFTLQYFAIAPISVLFRQIQDAVCSSQKNMKIIHRQTPDVVVKDLSVKQWFSKFRIFSRKVEMDIIRMLPEMHVQIGVLIAGPRIQTSFLNDTERTGHQLARWVTLNICNIELLVSPNLEDNIGLSHERIVEPEIESDCKDYSCQGNITCNAYLKLYGLKIYLGEPTTNQKYQIAVLSPVTTQLNYLRKDHYSLGSSIVSFSAALDWVSTGFSSLIFLDELYYFVKIVYGVFYESLAPSKNGSDSVLDYEDWSGEGGYVESDSGEKYINKSHELLLDVNTQFTARTTCEIKSFDVVLHNSRKAVNVENYNNTNSTTIDLSGNGIYISLRHCNMEFAYTEGNIDAVVDTTGFRLAIFRYLTEPEENSDNSGLQNLLRFLNFLTEASFFHTKLRLRLSKHMFHEASSVLDTERDDDRCLLVTVKFSGLYVAGCNIKGILVNQNNFEKLSLSFSAGEEFRKISCQSKGGYVLLEAAAVMMLIRCSSSYYLLLLELWPATRSSSKFDVAQSSRGMAVNLVNNPRVNPPEVQSQELLWDHIELVSMNLLPLSLVLVATDESGTVQELLLESDFHLNFERFNTARKLSMSISKLSLLSRFMHGAMKHIATEKVGSMSIQGQDKFHESPLNYILRDMQCLLAVEGSMKREQINPVHSNSVWVGSGSLSGLEITISLSELKMIFSALESVSVLSIKDETHKAESNQWFNNEESEDDIEEMVADGSVVAVQDVDQHTYITVEGAENRYDIAGTIHYSLVGKRSLFRVKYHNSIWNSNVKYFSLISLYAKDESGEPLRLNSCARSRFVGVSCPNDGGSALWTILPFKADQYEDVSELEPFRSLSKKRFHLINKKSDCAVAFVDGVLEFVGKPGHLFKWKVLSDPEVNQQNDSNDPDEVQPNGDQMGITVTVDKVTVTVVHELSDTEEKFLLLQGSIVSNQIILQITNSKVRFMSSVEVALHHFDAHWNSWMDFINPIQISTFYCFKFPSQENALKGVPSHLYAKFKEANILVTERALDILLIVIGELDLAGPYAIKSSVLLANCCKVENQSGLTLHCQFYDNQDVSVSPRHSTTTFLRHLALANQPQEASFFSVQLLQQGCLSTSPIHLSLSDARHFAWRTRIASSQHSKSFPGPFVVIEISRRIEEGLSIVISPSLRIHNETDFSLELRFQRPDSKEKESASLMLKAGSIIDDAMAAFSAVDLSGGSRKALTSLSVGNYVFSFRPNITDDSKKLKASKVEWSDDLKGEKPVRLSGIFDKLTYQVRKALSVDSVKVSLTSANCSIFSENGSSSKIHFLLQTISKGIPVINPDNLGYAPSSENSPVAMQERKEIFVLPTVEVTNLLHTEIHVSLTDTDSSNGTNQDNPLSRATIPYEAAVNFYANPSSMYFVITLISFGASCTPVNSSDWVRKLQKKKGDIRNLDIELEFGGGKYFAIMRLSRRSSGTLKVVIFTPYALQNDTNTPLFCVAANKKPSPRADIKESSLSISPDLGSYLPSNSIISWFLKLHKLHFKLLEEKALETELDLDALSGLTEIDLESEGSFGSKVITRLGVSLRPSMTKEASSQIILLRSRYVICNESEQSISVRQCYVEDMEEMIVVNSKQRVSLRLKTVKRNKKEISVVDKLLRKHTKPENDVSLFIQFRPNETGYSWSGPICVASLGRFFLKFRQPEQNKLGEFATVHVVEEGSTVVLQFDRSKRVNLPYKIENSLRDAPVTYYQKDSLEPETLGAGSSVDYVWDDLTLPHKLVIQLDDVHLLREINLDKVRAWKPFYRNKQIRNLGLNLPISKRPEDEKRTSYSRLGDKETVKVGYEIYAEGMTRVLRICEFSDRRKVIVVTGSSTKMRLRISYLAVHLLEHAKQDIDLGDPSSYAPIIIARFERLHWDSLLVSEHKYNQIRIRSLSVDEKWEGAPFAAMLRRHQTEKAEANEYILHVAVVLLPMRSGVKPVKYLSIVLQPLDLNLDEETLMKVVPFWRKSLSQSTSSQQYYFDHFEIHPIKIIASFLPGDSNYSYSSTQETLRSLLHSVIKIPAIKSKTIELNGVLVTHALITLREVGVKCAQHYSWYTMRAIYIAKGSPLLPPAFASVFDDLASSSLDVFFDPSSGVFNLPGVTLGTLKLISKFIDNKGISGTKRYFGDLGKTLKTAGSNMIFAAVTEVSDSVLRGAETSGFGGLVNGFHQGILKIAMEPSVLGSAFMEGGADRKIKLDRSPGVDELYIEGYLQAMLDTMYKQEYLRVRVIENQVILKNLPPSSSLIEEIMENVKDFLASKALLKGGSSTSHSLRHIRGEREWRIGPTMLTLCEHLFVSFAIQALRKQSGRLLTGIKWKDEPKVGEERAIVPKSSVDGQKMKLVWRWGIGRFLFSGLVAYVDGRLCRNIPHPLARRIVSGFLLSFLDRNDDETK